MPDAGGAVRRGRRGRRTGTMIRIARERISDLFALAEQESRAAPSPLADRYVRLARRIGMRYNVRLLSEYRDLYCRGCSVYWVEGRTVRTRLRGRHRTRTCLRCGRIRRVRLRAAPAGTAGAEARRAPAPQEEVSLTESETPDEASAEEGEEE